MKKQTGRRPLKIAVEAIGQGRSGYPGGTLTPGAAWDSFRPAVTLGFPGGTNGEVYLAQDAALADSNIYGMLENAMTLGAYGAAAQFLGYGILSNLTQNGIMRSAVEMRSDEMTREWITLKYEAPQKKKEQSGISEAEWQGKEPVKDAEAETEENLLPIINKELRRFKVRELFREAAQQCGYMGGCLAYIDIGDISDEELRSPLHLDKDTFEQGSLRGFRIIEPFNIAPGSYDTINPLSSHYFKPRTWFILGKEIHASRFLYFAENKVPTMLLPAYNFFGIPLTQVALDAVTHFEENREATSRLLSKFSLTVFKTNMSDLLSGGADEVSKRIQYLVQSRNNDGVEAIDMETEDIVKIETPLSGLTDIVRQSMEIAAAYFGEPAVKLWGISPGGFNATGESDIANHYDHIAAIQEGIFTTPLEKVLKILQLNKLGKIDNALSFDFVKLAKEDKNAKAMVQLTKANIAGALLDRGIIAPEEVRKALTEDVDSDFTNIDAEALPEGEPQADLMGGMSGGEPNGNPQGITSGAPEQGLGAALSTGA